MKALSNAALHPLTIWLEPWCDELSVPSRSAVSFRTILSSGEAGPSPDLELSDDILTVWAAAPGTLVLTIDSIEQDTGSRSIGPPAEMFDLTVKEFVGLVFGDRPEARPGGAPAPAKRTIWQQLLGR